MLRVIRLFATLFLSAWVTKAARKKNYHRTYMPSVISMSIRKARGNAAVALDTAEKHEALVKEKTEEATRASELKAKIEAEKEAAASEAAAAQKLASEKAVAAAEAAKAHVASKAGWNEAQTEQLRTQDVLQAAVAENNKLAKEGAAKILEIRKTIADAEAAVAQAKADADEAAQKAKYLRIAYQTAKEEDEESVDALKVALEMLDIANEKTAAKSEEARKASKEAQEAQIALDDAVSEWNKAKADVQRKKKLKNLLWDLYDRIEEFYQAASGLAKHMRRNEDDCVGDPHDCLISEERHGGHAKLKEVLQNWNSMILAFMEIKEPFPAVYEEISDASNEIQKNGVSQITLICDPDMTLELAAKASGDSTDYHAKCGAGLWAAVGLKKNRVLFTTW